MRGRRAKRVTPLVLLGAALGVLALTSLPALSSAKTHRFSKPLKLPKTPPKGSLPGGEPSVAFDGKGRYVYVVAPGGGTNGGVGFWRSKNRGRTFPLAKSLGSLAGGGDADVSVGPNHLLYVADLEVAGNALCRSRNHGKSFDGGCDTGIATNETGLESDRQWVSPSPGDPDLVYFSYHDFVLETPLVYVSTTQGSPNSFTPCGPVLEPGGEAAANFVPGGTNQGKLLVTQSGSIYVPILEPTNPATVMDPYNNFYVAIARHGCDSGTGFVDETAYSNPGANLANIFPYVVADGAGNVYAAFTGISGRQGDHFGVYLLVSRNGGRSWSNPVRIDPKKSKANALASLTAGPRAGQVALGFYTTRTTADPNSDQNRWRFKVATSRRFGHKRRYSLITRRPIHYGKICTTGILCTGGRNLLDFSSVEVNPRTGCVLAVFAGDPFDNPTNMATDNAAVYVSRQTKRCFPRHRRHHHR